MAYRISQPLATTPLPGDGKKKKRVTKTKRVISEGRGNVTYKRKTVRGKDGKVKKEVTSDKTKDPAGGIKNLMKGKDVTRYKKDGTAVTRSKSKVYGVSKSKGKVVTKGQKTISSKSREVEPTNNYPFKKKRQTTKTMKGTNKYMYTKTIKQNPRKTTTKRSYKRQD